MSEFVRLDQPTLPGPELPFPFYYHCMTKINEDLVVFTGGVWSEKTTLIVNVTNNFEMVEGPNMNWGRYLHACGTFEYHGKSIVIVVGGASGNDELRTELWDPYSNSGWMEGCMQFYFFFKVMYLHLIFRT